MARTYRTYFGCLHFGATVGATTSCSVRATRCVLPPSPAVSTPPFTPSASNPATRAWVVLGRFSLPYSRSARTVTQNGPLESS
eukprot:15338571-Alexandrium_andersonii.AAC.1